jgi:hypothetical protein
MTLAELFPDDDYKFQLRFERGAPAEFFAPTLRHAELVAERQRWLRDEPQTYAALLPGGEAMVEEVGKLAKEWNDFTLPASAKSPWEKCLALGEFWETDFLLLKCDAGGEIRLHGGCLCFPSSWKLTDKIGKPIELIHAPVPGLNAIIGAGIYKFLANLKPGAASLRHNWGLARSAEMNHHPDRNLPRLDAMVNEREVWLRVEHQALVALPDSGGILFGIRVVNHSLAEVKADALATNRLIRALETMPEEMAVYKGIASARPQILQLLKR